jgi:phosphate transport system substrate-binding protein
MSSRVALGLCLKPLTLLLALALATGCGSGVKTTSRQITIKGSDTMVHLTNAWAEEYMKTHPGTSISVTGGGTGTGIAALINGTTDICAASRPMTDEEKQKAAHGGKAIQEYVPALDGIAVIVNPQNPISELTMEQLAKIFTGEIKNWSALGGPDKTILVISRESSSGTYQFFQEHVLNKKDYSKDALMLPASSGIVQTVQRDALAISYVGLGYVQEAKGAVKALAIKKDTDSPAIMPTEAAIKDGTYPISRALQLYASGDASPEAKAFLDYTLSAPGQEVVRAQGFVSAS